MHGEALVGGGVGLLGDLEVGAAWRLAGAWLRFGGACGVSRRWEWGERAGGACGAVLAAGAWSSGEGAGRWSSVATGQTNAGIACVVRRGDPVLGYLERKVGGGRWLWGTSSGQLVEPMPAGPSV